MRKSFFYLIFIGAFLFVFQIDLHAQCAMCKQAAESSLKVNPNSMARSLNSGILYLMAVPYLLIAFIFRKQLFQLWKRVFKKSIKAEEIN
jgi:hypothetical protein